MIMDMKRYKVLSVALLSLVFAACSEITDMVPQSGTMLATQVQETNLIAPSRAEASFAGMFSSIGQPAKMYSTPDDWQFLMINFCNDLEGADALIADSGYNWFSVCGELSSRNANYRNPYIRYRAPYNMIANVNTFILSYPEDVSDPKAINMIAQAKALRAYSYMALAPSYQFGYQYAADQPCVPSLRTLRTTRAPASATSTPRSSPTSTMQWNTSKALPVPPRRISTATLPTVSAPVHTSIWVNGRRPMTTP